MHRETLRLEGRGALRELVLARPRVHNAINQQMLEDLLAACAAIEAEPAIRCVIVRGEGPSFCSGADLSEGLTHSGTLGQALYRGRLGQRVVDALTELPPITIAAVHGHAIGGGASLTTACDFRIAAAGARVAIREASLGLSLAWHTVPKVVHLVGPARAKRMILFGEPHPADQLLDWGFFDEVVPAAELPAAARALADKVLRQPPLPVQMTKASVNAATQALDRAVFHMDAPGVAWTGRTRDAARAREAFFRGETPDWEGE